MHAANPFFAGLGEDPLTGRRPDPETPEFDITAMVDLVFMMNIYFIVTFITVALAELNLPTASHCEPLDADQAVIVSLLGTPDGKGVLMKLGTESDAPQVTGADEQATRVAAAVEQGKSGGKTEVLIKAEKKVHLGELFRIATAASLEGMKLHVAVTETDAEK